MRWRVLSVCWLAALCLPLPAAAQAPQGPADAPYTLRVPVDEIALTFHAGDVDGKPLTHLTRNDLKLQDNGKRQDRIVMLQSYEDLPIRVGFLFDISASMYWSLPYNRSVIRTYAARLLRPKTDRAFVMQFDTETLITQPWTNDPSRIAAGAAAIPTEDPHTPTHFPFTAIFDSLYKTCRDQWTSDTGEPTGNFILMFTDGVDDNSHAYLREAVDMCQRTRTAIYAIVNGHESGFSEGRRTLTALTEQTGGRVFFDPRGDQLLKDLALMEAEQRTQYRLVYKPSNFKADSSFHTVHLRCSVSGARITARSGYYAFARP
jgi:Ca-activated chloride channel homolog